MAPAPLIWIEPAGKDDVLSEDEEVLEAFAAVPQADKASAATMMTTTKLLNFLFIFIFLIIFPFIYSKDTTETLTFLKG